MLDSKKYHNLGIFQVIRTMLVYSKHHKCELLLFLRTQAPHFPLRHNLSFYTLFEQEITLKSVFHSKKFSEVGDMVQDIAFSHPNKFN